MHYAPHKICSYMSRPGPKSRSGILLSIMIMQSISPSQAVATDARVAGIVTRPAGASQAMRATSSNQEAKHRGSQVTPFSEAPGSFREYEHLTRTGKRSYHRAVLRAARHGTTNYRGRQHTLRTLGAGQHTMAEDSTRSPISLTRRGPVPVCCATMSRSHMELGGTDHSQVSRDRTMVGRLSTAGVHDPHLHLNGNALVLHL